jgi:hypothetical protein
VPASISTPTALASEARPWEGSGWRAVEAQHKNATLSLVRGNLAEQDLLESIIEEAKPGLPATAAGLHFLLATPFRYPPPPSGSRFRAPLDAGVFYGAEDVKTACAEAGYWRLRFWLDSAGLAKRTTSLQMTLFEFHGSATAMIDLTRPPLAGRRSEWIGRNDYRATQSLAAQARSEAIQLIRYESARNGPDGRCLAVLTPQVFKNAREPYRHQQQNWNLFIQPPDLTVWQRTLTVDSFQFRFAYLSEPPDQR